MRWCKQWVGSLCAAFSIGLGNAGAQVPSVDSLQHRANAIYREHPAEALQLFGQAQRLALQQRKPDVVANSRVDEATVYYVMYDDYQRATTVCRAGLKLASLADSTRFKLWASLGEMYHQRNRPDSLAYCWKRADDLLTARPSLEREARTYVAAFWGNRGRVYIVQGDYRMAERCFQKRLLLLAHMNTPARQAIAENQFGYFYLKTGQRDRADSLFRASLRHSHSPDLMHSWFLLGLIECHLQRKQADSVPPLLREAIQIARRQGANGIEVMAYAHQAWGQYFSQKNQDQAALSQYNRSLAECEQVPGSESLIWRNFMALSRLMHQQGDMTKALFFVQRALHVASVRFVSPSITQNPLPTDFLNGPELVEALCWKAHLVQLASKVTNHLQLADQTYEQAFALSDLLQASYSSELTKLFVQEKLRPAFREAVAVAYTRYRQQPGRATLSALLYRQEQGNASVLHESIRALQNPYPGAPAQLLEAFQKAKSRLSAAKTNWTEHRNPIHTPAGSNQSISQQLVDTELVNAELTWNQVYQQLRPYASREQTSLTDVVHLQNHLDRETAFLQYSLTPDSLLLTVIKKRSVRVLMLPISRPQLTQFAETLRHEVYRNPDPFQYAGHVAARTLFDRLIGPVWPDLREIRRLVIVRDGPLHFLPLDVLETSARPNDYLLRYTAITYAYSLLSYVESSRPRPIDSPSVLSMAPFAVDETTLDLVKQRGYSVLKRSELETSSIHSTRSTAGNASKSTFLSLLPSYQILHLATHAEASDTNPDESYIAFFPEEASHRLYAHELGLLDLRHSWLAVLSGCRTGSGEFHEGEGLLSLSRAFASAGCPQVITSLWKAHDGTTATLTQLFYEELQRGQPTDLALQRAKLQFLATQTAGGAFTPPHFWAHLILLGTNQPVYPIPPTWPTGWLMAGSAGLLVALLYGHYRLRRRA